jgi:hypothetical protein
MVFFIPGYNSTMDKTIAAIIPWMKMKLMKCIMSESYTEEFRITI